MNTTTTTGDFLKSFVMLAAAGPVKLQFTDTESGQLVECIPGSGGVSSALRTAVESFGDWAWVADIGLRTTHHDVDPASVLSGVQDGDRVQAVRLDPHAYELFYNKFSTENLWFNFHGMVESMGPNDTEAWDAFQMVNNLFAENVLQRLVIDVGSVVWVNDYQMALVPKILRERDPTLKIVFFLHIPFPEPEVFEQLTNAREILEGVLGSDIIGFHVPEYRNAFIRTVQEVLGSEIEVLQNNNILYNGRLIRLRFYPIGINPKVYDAKEHHDAAMKARARHQRKIILGIDRLDPTKNISGRLEAYKRFLRYNPRWHNEVVFYQFAIPSREQVPRYVEERRRVQELVEEINATYGTTEWQPVVLVPGHMKPTELLTWYRAADVMFITPTRDGMNLVAKEFVQASFDGRLVLSQNAGVAWQLNRAGEFRIDPESIPDMARQLKRALETPPSSARRRLGRMRDIVCRYDVEWWAKQIMYDVTTLREDDWAASL